MQIHADGMHGASRNGEQIQKELIAMMSGSNNSLVRALNKLVSLTRACKPAEPNAIRPKVLTMPAHSEKVHKNKKQIKRNIVAALIVIVSLALLRKIA